jgi:NAD(P)-dependent dehydrogenase (short-subunit alcohol dehydrogenase family)
MLSGVFYGIKHEVPAILERGGGAIINTSSGAGLIGFPGMANYVAAKHGVIGLTKTAALEYIGQGIRINAICPGTARSRMVDEWMQGSAEAEAQVAALHPIGRIAEADEIAEAVLWLASPAASFVVGVAMPIDGGYTLP